MVEASGGFRPGGGGGRWGVYVRSGDDESGHAERKAWGREVMTERETEIMKGRKDKVFV